jgi:hypothetical protein
MDPVTVLVAALIAGTSAGVSTTASTAVQDSYASLRDAVRRRLAGDPIPAEVTDEIAIAGRLTAIEAALADPSGRRGQLEAMLTNAGISEDDELVKLAVRLLSPTAGVNVTTIGNVTGMMVGDHGHIVIRSDGQGSA